MFLRLFLQLRFGTPNEQISNTSIIEHAGKFYSVAENFVPQEIDVSNLETLGNWDLDGAWTRPFTSHPKVINNSITFQENLYLF